jgi:hypothetical protein
MILLIPFQKSEAFQRLECLEGDHRGEEDHPMLSKALSTASKGSRTQR